MKTLAASLILLFAVQETAIAETGKTGLACRSGSDYVRIHNLDDVTANTKNIIAWGANGYVSLHSLACGKIRRGNEVLALRCFGFYMGLADHRTLVMINLREMTATMGGFWHGERISLECKRELEP